jgi:hypothetical protein
MVIAFALCVVALNVMFVSLVFSGKVRKVVDSIIFN